MTIRKSLILPIALLIVALSVISVTTLFAKEDDATSPAVTPFASKVANILGMDEVKVFQVIEQAKSELQTERMSKKLSQMVEEGKLTQEEADEKLADLASDFKADGGVWAKDKSGVWAKDKMGYARVGHAWKKDFQKKPPRNREGIEERISQMVEKGILTEDEADRKLDALTAKLSARWGLATN